MGTDRPKPDNRWFIALSTIGSVLFVASLLTVFAVVAYLKGVEPRPIDTRKPDWAGSVQPGDEIVDVNRIETLMEPTPEMVAEAKRNPNGYVYLIAGTFAPTEDVPPHAIRGAWKVNANGEIVGEFIPNDRYEPKHSRQ